MDVLSPSTQFLDCSNRKSKAIHVLLILKSAVNTKEL